MVRRDGGQGLHAAGDASGGGCDRALRGRARKSYATFEGELRKQGCEVAGYRLLGAEDGGYSEFCCKRLVDDWRVITTFEPGVAIVVAVGRHDDRAFYAELAKTLAIGAAGQRRQEKPACCGEGGWTSPQKSLATQTSAAQRLQQQELRGQQDIAISMAWSRSS